MSASTRQSQTAINRWEKARKAYRYAQNYISKKSNKYIVTEIDLVLVSNFKGGSASICEPLDSAQKRLLQYSDKLKEISKLFGAANLSNLSKESVEKLAEKAFAFIHLTKENDAKIDGFGPSYASALLNIYFPELLPIIDRRVLNGAIINGAIFEDVKVKSGQVVDIEKYYKDYIVYCHNRLQQALHSLETLDRELFSIELQEHFKRKSKNK
jgi:hypothetical protein